MKHEDMVAEQSRASNSAEEFIRNLRNRNSANIDEKSDDSLDDADDKFKAAIDNFMDDMLDDSEDEVDMIMMQ